MLKITKQFFPTLTEISEFWCGDMIPFNKILFYALWLCIKFGHGFIVNGVNDAMVLSLGKSKSTAVTYGVEIVL